MVVSFSGRDFPFQLAKRVYCRLIFFILDLSLSPEDRDIGHGHWYDDIKEGFNTSRFPTCLRH